MSNGRRLSRGDKRRNARLERLREVLPREHAVLALDLADDKQVFALTDHDSRVLARKTVRCRPWQLGEALEWGRREALAAGFAGITLACEPTGHRWRIVDELATAAGIEVVCVQPLLVHQARVVGRGIQAGELTDLAGRDERGRMRPGPDPTARAGRGKTRI